MNAATYRTFRDTLLSLDDNIKRALFGELRVDLYGPDNNPPIDEMAKELREARFDKGLVCPRCAATTVRRHGTHQPKAGGAKRQRYLCTSCGRTFTDLTYSPLSGTHYPEKWARYFELMVLGWPLRKIAEEIGIHVSTAFYWRHKVLTTLREANIPGFSGILEADETYYLESMKGKNRVRTLGLREPRERGGSASKRGISREQVCVLVCHDRNHHVVAKVAGNGRITNEQVDAVLRPYIDGVTSLCTDSASCFRVYARKAKIGHELINANRGERVKKGIYHVQNVNAYHRRLRDWLRRFNGVATKYLDNYLFWHRFLDQSRRMATHPRKMAFIQESFKVTAQVKAIHYRPGLLAAA
jgi:transposase-like protein